MKILIVLMILAVGFVSSQVKRVQKPTNAKVTVPTSKPQTAQVRKLQKPANATQYSVTVAKSKLLAASNAVSSKEDVEEDFKNQLSAYSSWEDSLSDAPISIGLLGDLMMLSSLSKDFAIDGNVSLHRDILYVKYPKSFRATLVQIGNEAQTAFMVAHNNMDKIRLLTAGVPGYMKEATEILVTGDEELVSQYLPAPMIRIREAANFSVSLSMAVVWQFERVINLTAEVLELCISEKGLQKAKLEKTTREQKRVNSTLPLSQQMIEQLNSSIAKDAAVIERAEEDMRQALQKMPSGWEMIAMDFVQTLGNLLTAGFQTITSLAYNRVEGLIPGTLATLEEDAFTESQDSSEQQLTNPAAASADIEWDPCIIQQWKNILEVDGISRNLRESYKELESIDSASRGLYNPDGDRSKLNAVASQVEMCSPVAEIVRQGLEFVDELSRVARRQKPNNVTEEHFKKDRQSDLENVLELTGVKFRFSTTNLKNLLMANQQAVPLNTPLLSQARKKTNSKGWASQQALASSRNRAYLAQATLVNTRQAMERTIAKMIQQNEIAIKLLTEQQNLKLEEIRYEEFIKVLEKGLEKLAIFKEQWTKLVRFFQEIANIVQFVAAQSIEDFANHIETTSLELKNVYKKLVIDKMYVKATKATQATSLVNDMAETYVSVSDKYIIPAVSSLSKKIITDPRKVTMEREKLLDQCKRDSKSIVDLIVAHKKKIIHRIEQRKAQIKKEYAFLDPVKRRQIEVLRKETELEIEKQQRGRRKLSKEQKAIQVENVLALKIERDEFLRENYVLDDEDQSST